MCDPFLLPWSVETDEIYGRMTVQYSYNHVRQREVLRVGSNIKGMVGGWRGY